ncbi:MAG: hypothetical protein JWP89_815 [Schlesneria sp.]|nr:hypothetical protein [Schlesneria sp.]
MSSWPMTLRMPPGAMFPCHTCIDKIATRREVHGSQTMFHRYLT